MTRNHDGNGRKIHYFPRLPDYKSVLELLNVRLLKRYSTAFCYIGRALP